MRTRQALLSRRPGLSLWTLWVKNNSYILLYNSHKAFFFIIYSNHYWPRLATNGEIYWLNKQIDGVNTVKTHKPSLRVSKSSKLSHLQNPPARTTSISGPKPSGSGLKLRRAAGIAGLSVLLPGISAAQSKHAQRQTSSFATIQRSCSNSGYKRRSQRRSRCVRNAARVDKLSGKLRSRASVLNNLLPGLLSHPPLKASRWDAVGEQGTQALTRTWACACASISLNDNLNLFLINACSRVSRFSHLKKKMSRIFSKTEPNSSGPWPLCWACCMPVDRPQAGRTADGFLRCSLVGRSFVFHLRN